jgi:hypothetical protein
MGSNEIDAVGLVRQIRDDLYETTKGLSTEELIAFYRRHAAGTKERLSRLRSERGETELSKMPRPDRRTA